ncbi:hypothetical protein BGZ57DRAFT_408169 [Hyaloscypha finlandica]|nr:hypothetical protein BGZ57DRAFT_408169 [Hyaloscypha finlandica]
MKPLLPLLTFLSAVSSLPHPSLSTANPALSSTSLLARELPVEAAANTTASSCSQAVLALAAGIQANIADQDNELATVTALGNVLAQDPMDLTLYAATQASLLGFVQKGIQIREQNQKIAPAGNAAIAGLATVAMAQMAELSLTMSLALAANGTDVVKANATVETLKGDFKGGIKQNMMNLAAATANCTMSAATGSTAAKSVAY